MTHLKEDPKALLEQADELGYTAFGPVVLSFCAWLAKAARERGIHRLYFLAREGHFLEELFEKYLSLGLAKDGDFDARYLLVSRRAIFGAAEKSLDALEPMLECGPYEGNMHGLLEARIGISPTSSRSIGIPDTTIELPDDLQQALKTLQPALGGMNELARPEREALLHYLKQEGFFDDQRMGVVDVGYSASIQRWLGALSQRSVTGFYFATTIAVREWQSEENSVVACFASNCSLTRMPPVYRYALALESWMTAPSGQLVRFQMQDGKAIPEFAPPGRMQREFHMPKAVANGVRRYMDDFAYLARFDPDWERSLAATSQDILAAAMESRIFEDILNSFSVEDQFCGHGEISIFERIADLTADVRLSEVTDYEGEVK